MIRSLAATMLVTCALLNRGVAQDVTLDSTRHTVILRAGPFTAEPAGHDEHMGHAGHGQTDMLESDDLVQRFVWPCDAWLRGFALRLEDAQGRPLPLRWIHHLKMVNFARRQLVYPITERLIAVSRESHDVKLPASVGIPVRAGDELGVYVMWDAPADSATPVFIRIELRWSPTNLQPTPLSVLPLNMDVRFEVGHNTFPVPPGRHEWSYEFQLPIGGRFLLAGGHLHDYGAALRLEDATTGAVLVRLESRRDPNGRLLSVQRKILALGGAGVRLRAGRRYRLVAVYENPTADTIPGAMGIMGGLFAPDDVRRWPTIDPVNADYRLDLELLGGIVAAAGRAGAQELPK
jgi:hypothetical protein